VHDDWPTIGGDNAIFGANKEPWGSDKATLGVSRGKIIGDAMTSTSRTASDVSLRPSSGVPRNILTDRTSSIIVLEPGLVLLKQFLPIDVRTMESSITTLFKISSISITCRFKNS
jgi:hypothetical protein